MSVAQPAAPSDIASLPQQDDGAWAYLRALAPRPSGDNGNVADEGAEWWKRLASEAAAVRDSYPHFCVQEGQRRMRRDERL
jgi:hypothetical protein